MFNEAWLNLQLSSFEAAALTGPSAALNDCELAQQQQLDVLATLLALTAHSIALHMQHARFTVTQVTAIFSNAHAHACCNAALLLTRVPQVIVCGGGHAQRRAHAAAAAALPLSSHVLPLHYHLCLTKLSCLLIRFQFV
jgi:hypothetical protein